MIDCHYRLDVDTFRDYLLRPGAIAIDGFVVGPAAGSFMCRHNTGAACECTRRRATDPALTLFNLK